MTGAPGTARRRHTGAVVVAVVLAVAVAGAGGCAEPVSPRAVTILGVWSGREGQRFQRVLDGFRARHPGVAVVYEDSRNLSQVLRSQVSRGRPPDVVVFPNAGGLHAWLDQVWPLDGVVDDAVWAGYPRQWQDLVRSGRPERHAVPVNVTLKSLVWHHAGDDPPVTLEDLVAQAGAEPTNPWCLGVASSGDSGWPGTDWIEDLVLHQNDADTYRDWAAGRTPWTAEPVRRAWETWARIASGAEAAAAGNRTRALYTDYNAARRLMGGPLGDLPACRYEHQSSFALAEHEPGVRVAAFPSRDTGGPRRWVVSADLAALLTDSPDARRLIAYLATPEAQEVWARAGGLSANADPAVTAAYGDDERRVWLAGPLRGGDTLCVDASDVMPPTVRDAFQRSILAHLAHPDRLADLLDQLDQVTAHSRGTEPEAWLDTVCSP